MKAIDHSITRSFDKLTNQEQEEQNRFDLRELYYFYDMDWNKVRKVIEEMEEADNEAAFERATGANN